MNPKQQPQAPAYLVQIQGREANTGTSVRGTGIVLARDLILTCRHVVTSQKSDRPLKDLSITLKDRTITATREHCSDEKTDLAVLRLKEPLPEIELPDWGWPQGKLRGEELFLQGFPGGNYLSAAHEIHHKDDSKIQIKGRVDHGISGGVAQYANHPRYSCVGIVTWTVPTAAEIIPMPVIERFLSDKGLEGILTSQDPTRYLEYLDKSTKHIELPALGVTGTERFVPIKDLWIPSRTRGGELLSDALRRHRVLVIEGLAGSGKSTFVRRVVHAMLHPGSDSLRIHYKAPPLWVQVTQFETFLKERYPDGPPKAADPRWVAQCFAWQSAKGNWNLSEAYFAEKLRDRAAVLFLDGLDEASPIWREALAKMFRDAVDAFACGLLLTTRPEAEEDSRRSLLKGIRDAVHVPIDEMTRDEVDQFITLWTLKVPGTDAQGHADSLRANLKAKAAIRRMARNPLMLTMLAALTRKSHKLPEQRAQLFKAITGWLIQSREPDSQRERQLRGGLSFLALEMIRGKSKQKYQIGYGDAAQKLAGYLKGPVPAAYEFLESAEQDTCLVSERGGDLVFRHRSFQEYLAALYLADSPELRPKVVSSLLKSRQSPEVLRLLAGCLEESVAPETLDRLLSSILYGKAAWMKDLEGKAYTAGLVGSILQDLSKGYRLDAAMQDRYDSLLQEVERIFDAKVAGTIPVPVRVAAAEALAQGGKDRRLKLPHEPEYWVTVSAGRFRMGAQKKDPKLPNYDPDAYDDEPVSELLVEMPSFQIGQFPVTVFEYERYLDTCQIDPDTEWRERVGWDEQLEHPSRPVVQLTWDEADEYCRWATGRGLPTEQEWEFAARGEAPRDGQARKFPWGNEDPDENRANFDESWGKDPTPVGLFPLGTTPKTGIHEMAGNVWEWTGSQYDEQSKVLRGGAYDDEAGSLRCACRVRDAPDDWSSLIGFRCLREVST